MQFHNMDLQQITVLLGMYPGFVFTNYHYIIYKFNWIVFASDGQHHNIYLTYPNVIQPCVYGISAVLLLFFLLQLIISICLSAFACKATTYSDPQVRCFGISWIFWLQYKFSQKLEFKWILQDKNTLHVDSILLHFLTNPLSIKLYPICHGYVQ